MSLAGELAAAGGVSAPPQATARLRDLLADALRHGERELGQKRSGTREAPVTVAFAADGERLLAAVPVTAALHADAEALSERAWLLVAAVVGALVGLVEPGPPTGPEALAVRAGQALLGYPGAGFDPHTLEELGPLAFEEQVEGIDRLRAQALVVPAVVLGDAAGLREPIGSRHPLLIAEAVARLGGRPADPASVEAHEDAVLERRRRARGAHPRPRRPRSRPPRRAPHPPAPRRDGEVGRLPHGLRAPRARLRRQRPPARVGGRRGAARRRPAGREAQRRPAPRVPQPAPRGRHPAADRGGRGACRIELGPKVTYWIHMSSVPKHVSNTLQSIVTLTGAGIIRLQRPDRALRTAISLIRWGVTPAAGYEASAARYPDEVALIDELGQLTFREIQQRTNSLAHALADDGVNEGDGVAIMARNHRGFVEAVVACSKLGAHALFLNTSFSGPQLTDVADREKPKAIVYDEEFGEVLADAGHRRKRYISWAEPEGETKDPTLEELIERGDPSNVVPPKEHGKAIILTSGTTGTPKGASRSQPKSLDPVAALLERIPLKAREKTMIAAPLFHAWGFAHFTLGMGLSSTIVLKRKFDEEATLSLTAQHWPAPPLWIWLPPPTRSCTS